MARIDYPVSPDSNKLGALAGGYLQFPLFDLIVDLILMKISRSLDGIGSGFLLKKRLGGLGSGNLLRDANDLGGGNLLGSGFLLKKRIGGLGSGNLLREVNDLGGGNLL